MGDKVTIKVISANLSKRQLDYEWVIAIGEREEGPIKTEGRKPVGKHSKTWESKGHRTADGKGHRTGDGKRHKAAENKHRKTGAGGGVASAQARHKKKK